MRGLAMATDNEIPPELAAALKKAVSAEGLEVKIDRNGLIIFHKSQEGQFNLYSPGNSDSFEDSWKALEPRDLSLQDAQEDRCFEAGSKVSELLQSNDLTVVSSVFGLHLHCFD